MKDLVQIIKDNPKCVAIIDNDSWSLHKLHPYEDAPDEDAVSYEESEAWQQANELANSDDKLKPLGGGGYGSGNCYGGDILQALAQIVGIKVEGV